MALWQRVIVQDASEVIYQGGSGAEQDVSGAEPGDAVAKSVADNWLAWKKRVHLDAGWTVSLEVLDSVTLVRLGDGKRTHTRQFVIRSA